MSQLEVVSEDLYFLSQEHFEWLKATGINGKMTLL